MIVEIQVMTIKERLLTKLITTTFQEGSLKILRNNKISKYFLRQPKPNLTR